MAALNFGLVRSTLSYWLGALSEPVLMVTPAQMQVASAAGAVIWDVRDPDSVARDRPAGSIHLGPVDWLLADNLGGNLIPAPIIARGLQDVGIEPGRNVIIYAEASAVDAFVALRALRSIGIVDAQVCLGDAEPIIQAAPALNA